MTYMIQPPPPPYGIPLDLAALKLHTLSMIAFPRQVCKRQGCKERGLREVAVERAWLQQVRSARASPAFHKWGEGQNDKYEIDGDSAREPAPVLKKR